MWRAQLYETTPQTRIEQYLRQQNMADVHSPQQRSFNMSRIRSKDTAPELAVRSLIHQLGFRFRLHRKELPGKPDIVLPRHRKIVFVHGCFWHMHRCRYGKVVPKTNTDFWQKKRMCNVERDKRNLQQLRNDDWQILIIWECWIRDVDNKVVPRLKEFLAE